MKMLDYLECLRISADLIMFPSELGLLKRPTVAVIVSGQPLSPSSNLARHLQGTRHGKL